MSHYSYHNRLKQLLRTQKYITIKENDNPFSYRFLFPEIGKSMPIRPYRVVEYFDYLNC